MKDFKLKIKNDFAGFTLVEIIIAIGISSLLTGLMLPSFLNLIRTEKVNSYTRELKEYFRVVKLDSRMMARGSLRVAISMAIAPPRECPWSIILDSFPPVSPTMKSKTASPSSNIEASFGLPLV